MESQKETLPYLRDQTGDDLDPRVVKAGFDLASYHIQSGSRSFADFAQTMIQEYGYGVRPFLKSWYLAIRYYPGINSAGMDSAAMLDADDSLS